MNNIFGSLFSGGVGARRSSSSSSSSAAAASSSSSSQSSASASSSSARASSSSSSQSSQGAARSQQQSSPAASSAPLPFHHDGTMLDFLNLMGLARSSPPPSRPSPSRPPPSFGLDPRRDSSNPFSALFASAFGDVDGGLSGSLRQPSPLDSFWSPHVPPSGFSHGGSAPPCGPPPPSSKSLEDIPLVTVTAVDLQDASNKECTICLEENAVGSKVMRMPCGHLFHPQCLQGWIKDHCTCPTCRFELETDDCAYEEGRVRRMKGRKRRFHRHELDRMTPTELRGLVAAVGGQREALKIWRGAVEKRDVVENIVASGMVDIVKGNEQEERRWRAEMEKERMKGSRGGGGGGGYGAGEVGDMGRLKRVRDVLNVRELREKKIKELKDLVRNTYGVKFDDHSIVEREDLIAVLRKSGAVVLIDEEDEDVGVEGGGDFGDCKAYDARASRGGGASAADATSRMEEEYEMADAKAGNDDDYVVVDAAKGRPGGWGVGVGANDGGEGDDYAADEKESARASREEEAAGAERGAPRAESKWDAGAEGDGEEAKGGGARYGSGIAVDDLKRKSAGELRQIAKEGKVDISDCLEKGDIVNKILASGTVLIAESF